MANLFRPQKLQKEARYYSDYRLGSIISIKEALHNLNSYSAMFLQALQDQMRPSRPFDQISCLRMMISYRLLIRQGRSLTWDLFSLNVMSS